MTDVPTRDAGLMTPVARLATYRNGYPFKPDDPTDGGVPIVRIRQLLDASAPPDMYNGSVPAENRIDSGDLIFSWSGSLEVRRWNRGPAVLNQHLFRVDEAPGVSSAWLKWSLSYALHLFEPYMHGSAMKHITKPMLKAVKVPVPCLAQQDRIADFLDRESERIGQLVQATKVQMSMVEELLAAIREEALSGFDSMVAIRHVATTTAGAGFPIEDQGHSEGDFPFVKASDLQLASDGRRVDGAANWITRETARRLRATMVPEGATIFPKIGAAMLKNTRRIAGVPLVIDNNLTAVVPRHRSDSSVLFQLLCRVDLRRQANPGPVPSTSEGAIRSLRIPWGSERARDHMVSKVERTERDVTSLIAKLKLRENALVSLRSSLITEAVTGNIDLTGVSDSQMDEWAQAAVEGTAIPKPWVG